MPSAALERHPAALCTPLHGIWVSIERQSESLRVAYVLQGEIERLRIPASRAPRATARLWQHTCCEVFVAHALPAYREFNLSPSGEWAAYEFSRYREGKDLSIADPGIAVERSADRLQLSAVIPTNSQKIRLGLSAVIEDEHGALSYWALKHAAGKPDFHNPQAFALELDEARH